MAISQETWTGLGIFVAAAAGWFGKHFSIKRVDDTKPKPVTIQQSESAPMRPCEEHTDMCVAIAEIKKDIAAINKSVEEHGLIFSDMNHKINETRQGIELMKMQNQMILEHLGISKLKIARVG